MDEPKSIDTQQEIDNLKNQVLRLTAELQNQQKRNQREKEENLLYAEFQFAKHLLPVIDDMCRLLEQSYSDAPVYINGIKIIYDNFIKILSDHSITPINTINQPFDPSYHEAIIFQPDDNCNHNIIIKELLRGYIMHNRVLRHSKVIVSSKPV